MKRAYPTNVEIVGVYDSLGSSVSKWRIRWSIPIDSDEKLGLIRAVMRNENLQEGVLSLTDARDFWTFWRGNGQNSFIYFYVGNGRNPLQMEPFFKILSIVSKVQQQILDKFPNQ